jgi:hypothetical protein
MALIRDWVEEAKKLNEKECQEIEDALDRLASWSIFNSEYGRDLSAIGIIVHEQRNSLKKAN